MAQLAGCRYRARDSCLGRDQLPLALVPELGALDEVRIAGDRLRTQLAQEVV
jgi:hypothetical protein